MNTPGLGELLREVCEDTGTALLTTGELASFTEIAMTTTIKVINDTPGESLPVTFVIGQQPDGTAMVSNPRDYTKAELVQRFAFLAGTHVPLMGLYQIVTLAEAWLSEVVRLVVRHYPKKLSAKRTVPLATVLSCATLDAVHIAATDALLNELSYKSPRDFADEIKDIIGIDLFELPPFGRYIEVKATRDIWIHNRGIANEVYIRKAGSHARAKAGQPLPCDPRYFLQAYETTLQLVEELRDELARTWPPPVSTLSGNANDSVRPSGSA